MKEYIEREAVLEAIKEPYERVYGKCVYKPVEDVYRMIVKRINNSHAADVAPVVHGEWEIKKIGDGGTTRTCSNCNITQTVNIYNNKVMFRYCPYCGAKMDGVKLTSANLSRCRKCIHEVVCSKDKDYAGKCPNYKKDPPDGGYYG